MNNTKKIAKILTAKELQRLEQNQSIEAMLLKASDFGEEAL